MTFKEIAEKAKKRIIHTGNRYICKANEYLGGNVELKIIEIAPSRGFIKVMYLTGHTEWLNVDILDKDYKILEVLK
jgi:hypothetical protein